MASQNFRVKNGLEVGGDVTISSGIVTATSFSGNATISNYSTISGVSTSVIGGIGSITHLSVSGVSTFTGVIDANGGAEIDNIRIGVANDSTIDTSTGGLIIKSNSGTVSVDDNLAISGTNTLSFNTNSFNISHSGGNANIFNGLGDLILGADGNRSIRLERVGIATLARFTHNGSVELYHNNTKKFETIGAGATVSGTTFTNQLGVSGISTLGNTIVGGATTELIVNGDARITGILTIGTSSITFNGNNNSVTIGTGITVFGNTGVVNAVEFRGNGANLTGVGAFAAGTRLIFAQAAAPTGWTRITTDEANNRMLRVVSSGNGGGTGGSASPILNDVVPAHTHSFTTGGVSVDHTHSGTTGTVSSDHVHGVSFGAGQAGGTTRVGGSNLNVANTANTGGISANHTHAFTTGGISANHTHSGSTDNGSSQTNWAPRYIDTLLCSKD